MIKVDYPLSCKKMSNLAVIVFAYSTYLYNQESLEFVHWIRMIVFSIMGIIFILSTITYVFNKEYAWRGLVGGAALLPIPLMLQLLLFLLSIIRTIIRAIFEGNLPESLQVFIENYPSKFDIVILSVLIIIEILWIIDILRTRKE
ncbi:hypothetical protein [Niallia endozanthoxylica]|uniref:Uncharacterized protein n=1 Tax=Niallia endozanthoxylica TaxID=2036016 RepID=A0A5J5HQF9_9BACI|nr:hypothetical protein [Niallia endozanthoxylica]KAA9023972.1 hypothetical protein F4V44_12635 [Niallia endozanthoxylica]